MKVGDQIYDLMLKDTDPSKVYFEMDVYWTVMGQNDPVEYMQKHPDRIKVLHIKDRAVFGQSGMMNFEMIFKQMRERNQRLFCRVGANAGRTYSICGCEGLCRLFDQGSFCKMK